MNSSLSHLLAAGGSSQLECGDGGCLRLVVRLHPPASAAGVALRGELRCDLGWAPACSLFASQVRWRVHLLHLEQDVGGVVVLVGVVLGRREGSGVLGLGLDARLLTAGSWAREASGKVAHSHLAWDGRRLWCHVLVGVHVSESCVLGGLEHGRGNFTASSRTAHHWTGAAGHGAESEAAQVLL